MDYLDPKSLEPLSFPKSPRDWFSNIMCNPALVNKAYNIQVTHKTYNGGSTKSTHWS